MKRALVIQLTRFGDLVQTKRLVLTLQRRGFTVHLCIDRSLEGLARIIYPYCEIHSLIAHGSGIEGQGADTVLPVNYEIFRQLAEIDFKEVYNLNFSPMNYALSSMFDPAKVKGHKRVNGQVMKAPWFELGFRLATERRNNINLVDYWAALSPDMIPAAEVNPAASPGGGGIGVVLAGRESRRSLPYEVLAPLVMAARSTNKNKNIFLLGSKAERDAGRKLMAKFPASVAESTTNLAGETDWKGLADAVCGLDLLITPDTGTMHLGAHLGVPVLGFFLSSAWCSETGPYGKGHTILQADMDCSPCMEAGPCYNKIKCLDPFADPLTVRYVATRKSEHLSKGISVLESDCDFLGTGFVLKAGNDPTGERRQRLRKFIGCHLGLLDIGEHGPFPDLAEKFYKDKDWITP
ncbi:glycosyltransferase family 9 protein [Desulfovibrio sp. JC010]|uniref:glycosyltransferase family 9 protein n=1 Tax=Desulfovibrio sp. JC010 TaxID=2593641 RepID=UPI0013D2CC29|nr:glycosyltransferase family 9 protein [Desulfovibrio sp. JC010]NDV27971.1 glycosyltransferase family 9 protein [Desulfovibrio sp. JC010]